MTTPGDPRKFARHWIPLCSALARSSTPPRVPTTHDAGKADAVGPPKARDGGSDDSAQLHPISPRGVWGGGGVQTEYEKGKESKATAGDPDQNTCRATDKVFCFCLVLLLSCRVRYRRPTNRLSSNIIFFLFLFFPSLRIKVWRTFARVTQGISFHRRRKKAQVAR